MIGTITHILAKAGYKAMNGPLADERRRLAGAEPPAAYVSYDPRLLAGAGWYGYRIALKGGDRSMLERARYMLEQQYVIRDSYEYYADGIYTLGVLLRQRVPHYGIGGGSAPVQEPDALNFYMPDGGTITLTRNGSPTVVELEYSIDGGATWQVWEEVGNVRSLTLAAGRKMYVRNTSETSTGFCNGSSNYYNFDFSAETYSDGNTYSLLCKNPENAILTSSCFYYLFYSKNSNTRYNLKSTSRYPDKKAASYSFGYIYRNQFGLVKSANFESTELSSGALYGAHSGCAYITEAELLPATTIPSAAYYGIFNACSRLRVVKIAATSIISDSLGNWLNGVAATGDFYCPQALTIPTGASGIPEGWTRHDI